MRCPACGVDNDKVVDSRVVRDGSGVRRRREFEACGERFTTYENVESRPLMIVKRGGQKVVYNRNKVVAGLAKACQKRPVSRERIEAIVDTIEGELSAAATREVPTTDIGRMIMRELREVDEVAYVRFASVYRSFSSVEEFLGLLQSMQSDGKGRS